MAVVARKRASGTVYWVATSQRGEKYWERAGTDKREAQRLDARRKREVKAGTFTPGVGSGGSKVRTYAASWLAGRTVANADTERSLLRDYVLCRDWFASLPVRDVRPRHLIRLATELKQAPKAHRGEGTIAPKTVVLIMSAVQTMFRDAEIAELIDQNPVVLPRGTLIRKGKRREPYALEATRAVIFRAGHPARIVANALVLLTGMREGEACGRRWRDWDRNAEPLGALTVATQYCDDPLKTDNPRRVPVHADLAAILDWWWRVGWELVYCRKPRESDWIVPQLGAPEVAHTKSSFYKAWRRSCVASGVTNLSLHSTRHTFISLARRGGARPDVLERVTHNARGDMIDHYTTFDWAPLCEAVACFPTLSVDAPVDAILGGAVFGFGFAPAPGLEPGTRRLTAACSTD